MAYPNSGDCVFYHTDGDEKLGDGNGKFNYQLRS